ncbi:RNA polymerase sigma factor [Rhodoplanes serenus]|uniref:RNA polymerase sigma factor n=1 Tax=Rhodoplanes serenus TaxID=200615 RepID=UPI001FE0B54B|nr:sigma factor [Rhodoplanes serenus]
MLTSAELVWLLAATAKGDVAAFERLYGATRAKLYGIVLRILDRPDRAGEALQDAYLTIWSQAAGFAPGRDDPLVWMVAIARRHALDLARRPVSDRPMPDTAAAPKGDGQPDAAEAIGADGSGLDREADPDSEPESAPASPDEPPPSRPPVGPALERLLGSLGRLPPDRQRMILLAYFGGLDRDALARAFDRSPEAVRRDTRLALAEIRDGLGP